MQHYKMIQNFTLLYAKEREKKLVQSIEHLYFLWPLLKPFPLDLTVALHVIMYCNTTI